MNASDLKPASPQWPPGRFTLRPRFRTASLLWLVVVVSAFFLGQQSDKIVRRLSRIWLPSSTTVATCKLVNQSDGTLLIVGKLAIPELQVNNFGVCNVVPLDANRIRVEPKSDGTVQVLLRRQDGNAETVDIIVEKDTIVSTMHTVIPNINNSLAQNQAR